MKKSYLIFGDESGYDGTNRYASLAKVSGPYDSMLEINSKLQNILDLYNSSEIKFHKVKNVRYRNIASNFLEIGLEEILKNKLKLTAIVWDKHDSRHRIENRCDIENLKRMYYYNLKNLKRHWGIKTTWGFFPDTFSAIEWDSILSYVQNTKFDAKYNKEENLFEELHNIDFPQYKGYKELDSKQYPLLQLADIFAGIIRTSRAKSREYIYFLEEKKNQYCLFPDNEEIEISKNLKLKLELLDGFKERCSKYKLGVNFSTNKYFKTYSMSKGIFIQHYEPQGVYDKAPTKN